jgi:Spy/CpxP family protein refolding chaperone
MDTDQANRKAMVWLVVVFVLGVALGVLGTYVVTTRVSARGQEQHTAAAARAHYLDRLNHELNLSEDQQKQIDAIIANVQARYDAIHQSVVPQFEQARQDGRAQIRQILTPEQQPKFDEFMKHVDEERKAHEAAGGH